MSTVNVNNLNPNGDPVITVGPEADATEGARFGIIPAPSGQVLPASSVVFGHDALSTAGNKFSTTAIGTSAGKGCTTTTGSTFIGAQAGEGSTTPSYVTAVGYQAGYSGGESGTYIGAEAGENATGTANVCIGAKSGRQLTTGDRNILIGNYAGSNGDFPVNGIQTGSNNIVLQTEQGVTADAVDTSQNVFIGSGLGKLSFGDPTTQGKNVVIGHDAGSEATGVGQNVIIGKDAAKTADACSQAVVIGVGAAQSSTVLGNSTIVGGYAGQNAGGGNTGSVAASAAFFGHLAGAVTTGERNTCIGFRAGSKLTTGRNNLLLGAYAGSVGDAPAGALDAGENNIVLACGKIDEWADINTNISNSVVIGSSNQTQFYAGVSSITALSDARDKKDVKEISAGLDFIKELKPVDFIWDERKESGKRDIKDCGFLAQDLKEAEDKHGVADHLRLVDDKNPEKLLATYGRLLPVMVKAIQELSAEVEELKSK